MPLILKRTPRGRCRICRHIFFDTDSDRVIARHNQTCAQAFYEAQHPERSKLKELMDPWDPELEAHMRKEYKAGRLKPSTERIV